MAPRLAALLAVAWLLASCSAYMGLDHLGKSYSRRSDCTWFYGASLIDVGLTVTTGAVVATEMASHATVDCSTSTAEPKQCSTARDLWIPGVLSLSALWGYYQGRSCADQFEDAAASAPNARLGRRLGPAGSRRR